MVDIYRCEMLACDKEELTFTVERFGHTQTFRWLDPYMGLIVFVGQEDKGFLTTRQFDELFPDADCKILEE